MKSFRNIRIIPVVVVAVFCLAVLKVAGLVLDGGYVFDYDPQRTTSSWAQQNLNFPGGTKQVAQAPKDDGDVTGTVQGTPKDKPAEDKPKPQAPETRPDGVVVHPEDEQAPVSASERAILERLQQRRQELDTRAREIDIRESLLREAEKRIQSKVDEMKAIEAKAASDKQAKSAAENARLKGLVTTYENMKPKDAAKVFDRLEMPVLIQIASQIAPRNMSDIMGLMKPEAAERLTVELARRASGEKSDPATELPKIEGKVLPQK
ncbi:MAG TPA: flagellar protein FlbB [Bradyrhizobium sp.]|uniref:MotE family protein n=1 Tax=Bradyrhizobium sp. TaxID=376 RepID=UPI002BCE5B10|nr:flagellar protein FlbB [Bradyrhizobium sp.]HLZ05690.1 flagellar protein FlbB [Bradyrhizobium sp.]